MNKQVNSLTSYILENPIKSMIWFLAILLVVIVGITGFWPFFSTLPPMSSITFGLYNKDFWENFLVEAHGFLLDFIIFGVIVFGFDHLRAKRESNNQKEEAKRLAKAKAERRKKDEIERMLEELSDYADLDLPEVNRKKFGHIKRLQNYNVKLLDVTQLTLNGCNIKNFSFEDGSRLIGFQLQDGFMTNVSFDNVKMRSSYFTGSKLTSCTWVKCDITKLVLKDTSNAKGSKFIKCNMTNADLRNSNLTGAEFTGSHLADVKFEGAILDRADFRNTQGLDLEQLSKADSLNYVKISEEQLQKLKLLKPDIKVAKRILKAA
ncbi:pentapeptide repeat-containing protein [Vibrio alginolyticus]|uniref:pentapeptide repeat-containing protein n=1 Tax=Vibrio alginolyticus TaxID=663 RepID=UPI001A8DEB9D|nr:pentapeptide repeat-containing protein [Vibrio alginolyticus]MBO0161559.1 pentapeptide repeat-containing protein [Vibrio alginolyticus]